MPEQSTRFVQFIVKISKLCNLRCSYCYELKDLADPAVMPLEQLRAMYSHVRDYYVARDREDGARTEVRFIWHGGEPLLVDPSYYWQTFADQRAIFAGELPIANSAQTNLTVLDEERIDLLKRGFDSFGVSLDVFGGLRVTAGGRDSQARVIRNMDTLRARGLRFGAITVLTRKNLHAIDAIFRFYERSAMAFRMLPLFHGAFDDQHAGYELTTEQIVRAYCRLVDLWLESAAPPEILPITDYVTRVRRAMAGRLEPVYCDKRAWDSALLVNTNGDLYHTADPYGDPDWSLGNLVTTPLAAITASPAMEKSLHAADRRMAANCTSCRFFGTCSGHPIVEEVASCRGPGIPRCEVERPVFEHIAARLHEIYGAPAAASASPPSPSA